MKCIGKYEFPSQEDYKAVAAAVDPDIDTLAVIGQVTENFHVDVLWGDGEPEAWALYRVAEPVTNHMFRGFPYNQYKIQ